MNKISFNDTWICYRSGHPEEGFPTDVPHDAMLLDGKSETSPGGVNTGWYDAQDYTYEKNFFVPAEWNGKVLILEFEGVYRKATVSVNGRKALIMITDTRDFMLIFLNSCHMEKKTI